MIHFNFTDLGGISSYLELFIIILILMVLVRYIFRYIQKNPSSAFAIPNLYLYVSQTPDAVEICQWLKENTSDVNGQRYKPIQEISEACNLTYEQVRRGCFYSPYIYQLDDYSKEMWTVYPDGKEKAKK